MKRITKKLAASLCLLLVCTVLASCNKALVLEGPEAFAAQFAEEFVGALGESANVLPQIQEQYAEMPMQYDSMENFMKAEEEFGQYISYETKSVTRTDTSVYTVKGVSHFTGCDVDTSTVVTVAITGENRMTGEITYGIAYAEPFKFEKIKSFGEKMGNAGLNTLLGMGIVFVVLILISFIISLFSLINKFEAKQAAKKEAKKPEKPLAPVKAAPVETPVTDDTELIAVIAAAIAAMEGTSPDGIVVRSIRKVSSANNWKRG